MAELTKEQRKQVMPLLTEGLTVSQIAKRLGLTREYVQNFVSYLHPRSGA